MKKLDFTFHTPEQNLACDEALLDWCDQEDGPEILRFWEPSRHFVVLGISNSLESETHPEICRANRIPILRRTSGGGAVLQGPGCLNFSLILKIGDSGPLKSILQTNRHILTRHKEVLEPLLGSAIGIEGDTDLTVDRRKFSGNSQRRKKHALLFHGSFLLSMNIKLIEKLLPIPSRQPSYRRNRSHQTFLKNLPLGAALIKEALTNCWGASDLLRPDEIPLERIPGPEQLSPL